MIKKNIKIEINNGIIGRITSIPDGIEIVTDGNSDNYKDCIAVPAFTDSHCHVWGLGMKELGLDLSNCKSADDCCESAIAKPFKRGEWIIGRGWNQELWGGKMPDCNIIDKYFKDIPVCLTRIDGHAIWCNTKAMEISKIDSFSKVPGGEILMKNGKPSGIFIDNAMNLIERNIPDFSTEQLKSFILKGLEKALESGITFFHDMDVNQKLHDIYIELDKAGVLSHNVYSFLSAQNNEYLSFKEMKYSGNNYKVQGIKLYADGALGSRGAALFGKYNDDDTYGLLLLSDEEMFEKCKAAAALDFDIAVHAIGDRAVNQVLNVFQKIREAGYNKIKLRIEHSQLIQPDDVPRFRELDVIASVQPVHCTSDAAMADKRLGTERASLTGYKWKSLIDNGIEVIAGSDFPIESESVLAGINSFTKRIPAGSNKQWNSSEIIVFNYALGSYSINPHIAVGNINRGKIETGFIADMIICDKNTFSNENEKFEFQAVIKDGKRIDHKIFRADISNFPL